MKGIPRTAPGDSTAPAAVRERRRGSATVDHVSFRFGRGDDAPWVLEDVTLTAEPEQFVALVGPSGCGKTTLLRVIAGLLEPQRGGVILDGSLVSERRRSIGVVFQDDRLLPWRRVTDNIAIVLQARGYRRKEAVARALDLLAIVGLSGAAAKYPHQLSGGMRQRVNLARALAIEPDLVLLDEPFAALDAQTRELMQAELLGIWQANLATVVLVTHQLDEAVYLADKVIVMGRDPGRVLAEVQVPFARPRPLTIKHDPLFHEITDRVWRLIAGELGAGSSSQPA